MKINQTKYSFVEKIPKLNCFIKVIEKNQSCFINHIQEEWESFMNHDNKKKN